MAVDKKALLKGFAEMLNQRGIARPKPCLSEADRFFRWLFPKHISLYKATSALVHDYLCSRRARLRTYKSLHSVWHRLRLFLRYARQQEAVAEDPTHNVSCRWLGVPGGLPAYQGVLRDLHSMPFRLLQYRLPLFAPHWEPYLQRLLGEGYSKCTVRFILNVHCGFHRYLLERRIKSFSQVMPGLADDFLHRRKAQFRKIHGREPAKDYFPVIRAAIAKFLAFASGRPYSPRKKTGPPPDHPVLSDRLLAEYFDFCRQHKGLKDITIRDRSFQLWRLRAFLQQRGRRRIQDVTTADLDAFCIHRGAEAGGYTPHSVPETIRPFFRYLHLKGDIRSNPAEGIFSPCRFQMDRRPKFIPWPNVQKLLAGIDRSNPIGKRDYAILALLAHHGLRAREAAHLKLADIDWSAPSLWLHHRKNGANARIPLSQTAKEALQDYLALRPSSPPHLEVFLTSQAPVVPLGGRLGAVAQRHLFRFFGRSIPRHGAHVLRHSFAKALLDRGAKLHDIAALLGHRRINSTLTYTQIDTEGLREVADNYANLLLPPRQDQPPASTDPAS